MLTRLLFCVSLRDELKKERKAETREAKEAE